MKDKIIAGDLNSDFYTGSTSFANFEGASGYLDCRDSAIKQATA
jgi:hypothetical protein